MTNFSRFLLETAGEQQDPGLGGSIMGLILPIGIFGIVIYFMLYRPQKKQEKAVAAMRGSIEIGDEISTNGGIYGRVVQIKEDSLTIETGGDRTKIKIGKWAVRAIEKKADGAVEADDAEPKSTRYKIKKK